MTWKEWLKERGHRVPVVSYRPPQAGQPLASKVLTRHGLPASMGVWSLEHLLNKWINNITSDKSKRIKKMPSALRMASWKFRIMRTGLTNDLELVDYLN